MKRDCRCIYTMNIAPLDKRSIHLIKSLNANDCSKINFQELTSNEHVCSVEGHVVAIEAKGNASEYSVADGVNVVLTDTFELFCFDTKNIAGGPNPIHNVQPFQLQEPIEHLLVPVALAFEPPICKFRSGNNFVIRGRNWNILLVDLGENPVVPPVERDVGTIDSTILASFLDRICLVVGEYFPHFEKCDANEAREV